MREGPARWRSCRTSHPGKWYPSGEGRQAVGGNSPAYPSPAGALPPSHQGPCRVRCKDHIRNGCLSFANHCAIVRANSTSISKRLANHPTRRTPHDRTTTLTRMRQKTDGARGQEKKSLRAAPSFPGPRAARCLREPGGDPAPDRSNNDKKPHTFVGLRAFGVRVESSGGRGGCRAPARSAKSPAGAGSRGAVS